MIQEKKNYMASITLSGSIDDTDLTTVKTGLKKELSTTFAGKEYLLQLLEALDTSTTPIHSTTLLNLVDTVLQNDKAVQPADSKRILNILTIILRNAKEEYFVSQKHKNLANKLINSLPASVNNTLTFINSDTEYENFVNAVDSILDTLTNNYKNSESITEILKKSILQLNPLYSLTGKSQQSLAQDLNTLIAQKNINVRNRLPEFIEELIDLSSFYNTVTNTLTSNWESQLDNHIKKEVFTDLVNSTKAMPIHKLFEIQKMVFFLEETYKMLFGTNLDTWHILISPEFFVGEYNTGNKSKSPPTAATEKYVYRLTLPENKLLKDNLLTIDSSDTTNVPHKVYNKMNKDDEPNAETITTTYYAETKWYEGYLTTLSTLHTYVLNTSSQTTSGIAGLSSGYLIRKLDVKTTESFIIGSDNYIAVTNVDYGAMQNKIITAIKTLVKYLYS